MATPELRHMLRDDDLNHEEQKQVLELAIKFHNNRFYHQPFAGPQGIAVIFDKPSTRTRSSFSIGVAELGGYPLVIDKSGSQLGRGEPVADTARVLDRMAYGVVWRTFGQDRVEEMAKYSTHPVVNALTDEFHPCQILADFQTIAEHRGGVDNLKNQTIAYLGDAANNMSNSYLLGGAVAGMNVRVAGPNGYLPDPQIVADAEAIASETGGSVLVTTDPKEAVAGADCVFTDTWVRHPFQAVLGLSGERRTHVLCQGRRHLPALPAGIPWQGSHLRSHRRTTVRGVGRGRQPSACAEGTADLAYRQDPRR